MRFREYYRRYGAVSLLWIGLLVGGAKTPAEFLVWCCAASVFLFFLFSDVCFVPAQKPMLLTWLLLALLVISWRFSLDPSTSTLFTTEAAFFVLLWTGFVLGPDYRPTTEVLRKNLLALGHVVVLRSLYQLFSGEWRYLYGFFPVNPVFNTATLASVGIYTLGMSCADSHDLSTPETVFWLSRPFGIFSGLLMIAVAATGPTRSVMAALAASLAYLFLRSITVRRLIFALLLISVGAALTRHVWDGRIFRLSENNNRQKIWGIAIKALEKRPLFGIGASNFEMAYQSYSFPVVGDTIRYARSTGFAHSEPLQFAVDFGLPSSLLLLLLLLLPFLKAPKPIDTKIVYRPVFASLLLMSIIAINNIIWHLPFTGYLTLLWLAVILPPLAHFCPMPHRKFWASTFGFALSVSLVLSAWCALRAHWESQERWDKILNFNPRDAWAWKSWADHQNRLEESLPGYQNAVLLVPKQVFFREAYGLALEATNDRALLPSALEQYDEARHIAPHRAVNLLAEGRVLLKMQQPGAALEKFRQARQIEPSYWETDLWIARCHAATGSLNRAIWVLENLRRRREQYLAWRTRTMTDDLSSAANAPSPYDRIILSYDSRVIEGILRQLRTAQTNRA